MVSDFTSTLDRAKLRDREAQSALCDLCFPIVSRYVHKNIADATAVNEVISDIFVKVLEGLPSVRAENESSFLAWTSRIAHDRVVDYYRGSNKKRKTEPLSVERSKELENYTGSDDPVQIAENRETVHALLESMEQLTEEERRIVTERFVHGHGFAEIGEHIGKTAGAVRVIQHRALQRIKPWLRALLAIALLIGALFGIDVVLVRAAQPDSPLYPMRMWQEQIEHSLTGTPPHPQPPHGKPSSAMPSAALPGVTPTATLTALPTAASTANVATATATPTTPTPQATVTVTTTAAITTRACLFRTCVRASLP